MLRLIDLLHASRLDSDRARSGIDGSCARFDDLGELFRIQADVRGAGRARDDAVLPQPAEALPHLMQALRALENDLVILGASHGGSKRISSQRNRPASAAAKNRRVNFNASTNCMNA